MANITSPAPKPAQPSAPFSPASVLQLFAQYTRASYLAAFGSDPATYNPTLRPKDWFDTNLVAFQPSDVVTYNFVDTSTPGKPIINQIQMTVAEAAAPNFPGVHSYPMPGPPAPTTALEILIGNPPQLVNPTQLSSLADAQALAKAWGVDPSLINEWAPPASITFQWNSETRRIYQIPYNGLQRQVAMFVAEQNANGIGAPGNWDFSNGTPKWVSTLPASVPVTLSPWPEPVRALLPNEALWSGLFGGCVVYRTDMTSQYNPAPVATGGGLTAAQDALLTAIGQAVGAIKKDVEGVDAVFGVPTA